MCGCRSRKIPATSLLQLAGGLIPSSGGEVTEVPQLAPVPDSEGGEDSGAPEGSEQPGESGSGQVPGAFDSGPTPGSAKPPAPADKGPSGESTTSVDRRWVRRRPSRRTHTPCPAARRPFSSFAASETENHCLHATHAPARPKPASRLVEINLVSDPAWSESRYRPQDPVVVRRALHTRNPAR